MGEIINITRKVSVLFLLLFLLSCSTREDVKIADFDISKIEGEYTAQLKMDFSGPRPEVSVFGGSVVVDMVGADNFTVSVDFPDDYITDVFTGSVIEKIVDTGNSALGGVSFLVEETAELAANPDKIDIQTRDGELKKAHAVFIESVDGKLKMLLYMIEKDESPTEFEFLASK